MWSPTRLLLAVCVLMVSVAHGQEADERPADEAPPLVVPAATLIAKPPVPGSEPVKSPAADVGKPPPNAASRAEGTTGVRPFDDIRADVNPEGRLQVSFRDQSWSSVLTWFGQVAGLSLDWQELPKEPVNLVTNRDYSVPELHNLLNRHLLERDFTLLKRDELLLVVSLNGIDAGLVPRVSPAELAALPDYDFVRVTFPMQWMLATSAVEDLRPLLSRHGRLTAFKNSNRLQAMDAVIHLREVWELLEEEQAVGVSDHLLRSFPMHYVRAELVVDDLKALLGQSSEVSVANPSGVAEQVEGSPEVRHQGRGKAARAGTAKVPSAQTHIVYDARQNMILVTAPRDKLDFIGRAIEVLDQPPGEVAIGYDLVARIQTYRLHNVDPTSLVATLRRVGALSPQTTLQVDEAQRLLIVSAAPSDQTLITKLVAKLDGSPRGFYVRELRKLPVESVAGSIRFLVGNAPEATKTANGFRIEPDRHLNRLLLWCNPRELRDIDDLLAKLGESSTESERSNSFLTRHGR